MVTLAGGLSIVSWRLWRHGASGPPLTEIRGLIQSGKTPQRRERPGGRAGRDPGSDEAAYLLGFCEKSLGRPMRRPKLGPGAGLYRFRHACGAGSAPPCKSIVGRLADAEELIERCCATPQSTVSPPPIYDPPFHGMKEGSRRHGGWWNQTGGSEAAGLGGSGSSHRIGTVIYRLGPWFDPLPNAQFFLERAAGLAPEDDRVWLGRANLAIRRGEFDEASRWIDSCLGDRPGHSSGATGWTGRWRRVASPGERGRGSIPVKIRAGRRSTVGAWAAATTRG